MRQRKRDRQRKTEIDRRIDGQTDGKRCLIYQVPHFSPVGVYSSRIISMELLVFYILDLGTHIF